MIFREMLLDEFDAEMKSTRKVLERVPEASLAWKPHEKSMTLGRLAGHLSEIPGRAASIIRMDTMVRQPGYMPFVAASSRDLLEKFRNRKRRGAKRHRELAGRPGCSDLGPQAGR